MERRASKTEVSIQGNRRRDTSIPKIALEVEQSSGKISLAKAVRRLNNQTNNKKELLVVELKKGRVSDVVIGQIQSYMCYVKEELA